MENTTYFSKEDIEKSLKFFENKLNPKQNHKLKTTWIVEMAQDINACFGIDAEKELELKNISI